MNQNLRVAIMSIIGILVIGLITVVCCTACTSDFGTRPALEAKNSQFGGTNYEHYLDVFYDRDTGVCYVMSKMGGICPLYNPDGSLKMVTE